MCFPALWAAEGQQLEGAPLECLGVPLSSHSCLGLWAEEILQMVVLGWHSCTRAGVNRCGWAGVLTLCTNRIEAVLRSLHSCLLALCVVTSVQRSNQPRGAVVGRWSTSVGSAKCSALCSSLPHPSLYPYTHVINIGVLCIVC